MNVVLGDTTYDFCVTANDNPRLTDVTDAPMTVYWTDTEGADGVVTIAMSTPRTDAGACGACFQVARTSSF